MTKGQQSSSADGAAAIPGVPAAPSVPSREPSIGPVGGGRPRRRRRMSATEVATYGVLAALALVLGYLEALLPLPIPVPGVKLGLANIVVLYALAVMGLVPGLVIMLVKVLASALLFGSPTMLAYSLAGAALSFAAMALAIRARGLSLVGVSVVGGVCHMLGQLIVVGLVLTWPIAALYLPVLVLAGVASGVVVGLLCRLVIHATRSSSVLRAQRKRIVLQAKKGSR